MGDSKDTSSLSSDSRGELDELLRAFLDASLTLGEFESQFSAVYLSLPDDAFSDAEWEMYTEVHDKLEITSNSVSDDDRHDGWIDADDLRAWIRRDLRRSYGWMRSF